MERASRSRGFVSFQPAFLAHFTSCRYISRIFFPLYQDRTTSCIHFERATVLFSARFSFVSTRFFSLETPPIWFRVIVKQKKKNKRKNHAYRSGVFATALIFFVKYLYFICFLLGRLYPAWDICFYTSVFTRIDCIFISQF